MTPVTQFCIELVTSRSLGKAARIDTGRDLEPVSRSRRSLHRNESHSPFDPRRRRRAEPLSARNRLCLRGNDHPQRLDLDRAPLATKLAKAFVRKNKGTKFVILQGGSDIGINDVAHGRVTIGNASRKPQPSDPGGLVFNRIAYDAVCLITNPSNPLAGLSQDQVQSIFTGRTAAGARSGAEISGRSTSSPARPPPVPRTRSERSSSATPSASPRARRRSRRTACRPGGPDHNAIGFVSLDFVQGVYDVPYQGVACTLRNAKSGQYRGPPLLARDARHGDGRGEVVHHFASSAAPPDRQHPLGSLS